MPPLPVSKICPQCGSRDYISERASSFVSYANDRRCRSCNTLYKLPTPLWAAIVFIVFGAFIALGPIGAVASIIKGDNALHKATPQQVFLVALMGVLGIGCVVHGIRSIVNPNR